MALVPAAARLDQLPSESAVGQFEDLAMELEQGLDRLGATVLERYGDRLGVSTELPSVGRAEIPALIHDALRAQLRDFRRGVLPARCPEFVLEDVRAVLSLRRLDLLLTGYRIAHEVLWEAWFELVEHSPLAGAQRHQELQNGSEFFFRYEAMLSDFTAAEFQSGLELAPANTDQRRFQAIRAILEEDPNAPSLLDFDLERHHLGVLARGEETEAVIRRLAILLERPILLTGPPCGVRWAWISGTRSFQPSEERLLERIQPPPGTHLAVGQPAYGEAGFRATHRQAQRAHWASRFSDQRLTLYADVAAESLAGENPEEARRFVDRELCGLGDDSTDSQRSRETLIAYFDCEHNAASAAARLGVHQQTVANRLRAIEDRLGRPVGSRRVELELALRLHAILLGSES